MSGRISGALRDAATTQLIPAATVTAPPYLVSNRNGTYTFTTPAGAIAELTATAPNYVTQKAAVTVSEGGTVTKNFDLVHL